MKTVKQAIMNTVVVLIVHFSKLDDIVSCAKYVHRHVSYYKKIIYVYKYIMYKYIMYINA